MLLNSINPDDVGTLKLRDELEEKYSVPVIPVNCAQMRGDDISSIMERILYEFPVCEIGVNIPKWVEDLRKTTG